MDRMNESGSSGRSWRRLQDRAADGRRAHDRRLTTLLVLLAVESAAVASLGTPLLPTVQRVDHVSLAASQWTLTIALLVGAVVTPLMGRLGDTSARRATTLGALGVMLMGCLCSALSAGFAVFVAGRALQGAGLGLVPLATAYARDALSGDQRRRAIVVIGITTAAGIGIGYPLVGLLAEFLGFGAPFWLVAALTAAVLVAALALLPVSPTREVRVDLWGTVALGAGIAGLLLALAEGGSWGWTAPATVACALAGITFIWVFCRRELHVTHPLVEFRLLRERPVMAANVTAFLVAVGFYPLMSLVVRFVQTPRVAGYGFGAGVVVAGLMLTPFSLASFSASRLVHRLVHLLSSEWIVALSCIPLVASMAVFAVARGSYLGLVVSMILSGLGVGGVYAINPLQITRGVPADETGSAMSFYQLVRTVAYSIASTLSATLLLLGSPSGRVFPADGAYSGAAYVGIGILVLGMFASFGFAARLGTSESVVPPRPSVGGHLP